MTICPSLPEPWQMVVSKDKKKQFDVLEAVDERPGCDRKW